VLNFIYYPVSAILWFWHKVFAFALPEGLAWTLAVVFLVFSLRALLYKPFVHQVRSMRKMQEFAPEIQKLKKKYGNDKQKMALEMQKLQGEHGVNPLGGCLPVLVQVPVFIGLFHVLKGFQPGWPKNYVFDKAGVDSFNSASVFGAKLGAALHPYTGGASLSAYNTTVTSQLIVMVPLAIAAAIFTHITARHSIARQTEAQAANPQAAMMNKLMLWLFPVGAIAGSPFLPLAILFYWVANNLWTLGQQRIVYNKIDSEELEAKTRKTEARANLAPKVGQKPVVAQKPGVGQKPVVEPKQKKPGAKPIAPRTSKNGAPKAGGRSPSGTTNGNGNGSAPVAPSGDPGTNGGGSPTPGRGRKR
jgi:YidC/Oxa1 family membrane protein insertase